jgi:hypothetical protein
MINDTKLCPSFPWKNCGKSRNPVRITIQSVRDPNVGPLEYEVVVVVVVVVVAVTICPYICRNSIILCYQRLLFIIFKDNPLTYLLTELSPS